MLGLPQGAAETAPPVRFSATFDDGVIWKIGFQVGTDANGPHSRTSTSMRNAEGFVQTEVHHIWSKLPRLGNAHQSVQVGSIHVNLSTKAWMVSQILRISSSKTP